MTSAMQAVEQMKALGPLVAKTVMEGHNAELLKIRQGLAARRQEWERRHQAEIAKLAKADEAARRDLEKARAAEREATGRAVALEVALSDERGRWGTHVPAMRAEMLAHADLRLKLALEEAEAAMKSFDFRAISAPAQLVPKPYGGALSRLPEAFRAPSGSSPTARQTEPQVIAREAIEWFRDLLMDTPNPDVDATLSDFYAKLPAPFAQKVRGATLKAQAA